MQKGIIKNVNKLTGEPIDAKDLASMLSGIIGNESGALTVFDELRLEKISDNKVRLHSGVYSLKGHILYIPKGSYEDFEIESGTLGANRIDLLVAEYVKNGEGDGEDTLRFRVIKGKATSGIPEEPPLIQQDINENGIIAQEILYQLNIESLKLNIKKRFMITSNIQNINTKIKNNSEETSAKLKNIENQMGGKYAILFDGRGYWDNQLFHIDKLKKFKQIGVVTSLSGNAMLTGTTVLEFAQNPYISLTSSHSDRQERTMSVYNVILSVREDYVYYHSSGLLRLEGAELKSFSNLGPIIRVYGLY